MLQLWLEYQILKPKVLVRSVKIIVTYDGRSGLNNRLVGFLIDYSVFPRLRIYRICFTSILILYLYKAAFFV